MLLDEITSPDDLRDLGPQDLSRLCGEIREFLVAAVSRTGGHLGPNLGVVELTVAVHRVFHSPRDALVFDTGHQAYVHKMLTGRLAGFDRLRQRGGLSGYPNRAESEHDIVENSHASTGLSYALALASARQLTGEPGKVVCVVGDGALTGGMAYEALNNIGHLRPDLIIILNDNGRSYAPTIGGIAENLGQLRLSPTYEAAKDATGRTLRHLPLVGNSAYQAAKRVKESLKQLVSTTSIFETLGLKYGGPIDGHDIAALERALRDAAAYRGPVVIHVVTNKGNGYAPAVQDEIDKYHGVSSFNPEDGSFTSKAVSWTDLFGEALLEAAEQDSRIVAITAAMASSTGPARVRGAVPGPLLRRRNRRAARGHLRQRAGHEGAPPGGLHLLVVPATRLRPDRLRRLPASPPGDLRHRPGRDHRRGRAVAPRHARPRLPALHPQPGGERAEQPRRDAPDAGHRAGP